MILVIASHTRATPASRTAASSALSVSETQLGAAFPFFEGRPSPLMVSWSCVSRRRCAGVARRAFRT